MIMGGGRGGLQTRLVAGLVAVLAVLPGCSSGADSAQSSTSTDGRPDPSARPPSVTAPVATPAVPGMSGLAVRLRTDVAVGGQFQTRISNTGSEPFSVLGVSLDSPGFERLPVTGRTADYNPGATIDLPTPYGPAVCGEGVRVDPLFTALQVQRPDGRTEEIRLPLEAPDDIIARIHREECHVLALAAAATVRLGSDLSSEQADGQAVLRTTVNLTRGTNTEAIALVGLRGSVVFDLLFADDSEPPPSMPADENELVVPVVLRNATCEAHVLGETKQPFLFPFYVTFDGGEAQYGTLEVSPEQQDALWSYIQTVCAAA